eukprot:3192642-Rhodomonas_salina.1
MPGSTIRYARTAHRSTIRYASTAHRTTIRYDICYAMSGTDLGAYGCEQEPYFTSFGDSSVLLVKLVLG